MKIYSKVYVFIYTSCLILFCKALSLLYFCIAYNCFHKKIETTVVKQEDSSEQILFLIKSEGPMSAKELSVELGITTMGTRQHLQKLYEQGFVQTREEKRARGRPVNLWRLTVAGHERFSDRHANLTIDLIYQIKKHFGANGLSEIIKQRSRQSLDYYQSELKGLKLKARITRLAQMRNNEGYMASVVKTEQGYVLLENHCPICAAAKVCQGFCDNELQNFQACFEGLAKVERCEYILDGGTRCSYSIIALQAPLQERNPS